MVDYNTFCIQWQKWLDDCLTEYNQKFEPRQFHQDNCPDDYEPGQLVEFGENGDAYPHGAGGTIWIREVVTPWQASPHFVK